MTEKNRARLMLISSMVIFGTIGIFREYIPLPSSVIALARSFIGVLTLMLPVFIGKVRLSLADIRRNILPLFISGAVMGFNWILLFEAYRFTTVATATLCYYMAPIFVTVASPLLLSERISLKKGLCILVALIGMIPVSGVLAPSGVAAYNARGIIFGLLAAVFYATVVLINKKTKGISSYDRTVTQLAVAGAVLLPYVLLTEEVASLSFTVQGTVLLLVVGLIHTGIAYAMYFGSMQPLSAQTLALFSYIDPIVAILLSALILGEGLTPLTALGAVLILGSTLVSEISLKRKE